MHLFDSHCHLDDGAFSKELAQVVANAVQCGVAKMVTVGVDRESSIAAVKIAEQTAGIHATVGFHPHDARFCSEAGLEELAGLSSRPAVCAWGEIGLDFNRMHSPRKVQERWFVR